MVVLRLGKINNEERKFIPTKMEYLDRYLKSIEKREEYELTQTYNNGWKYRRYNDNGDIKYTKNNKMIKYTQVDKSNEKEFNEILQLNNGKCVRKIRKYYLDGNFEIDADYFKEPNDMIMIEVSTQQISLDDYIPPKGFVEVTNKKEYENYGIYNGSIKSVGTILEGTDGVGKSTTIESLIKEGIICRDREMEIFSKNMMFEIPMSLRANIYNEYLKNHKDLVIFLINKDKEELERRINSRNHISEFDLEAYRYNKLYLDTYLYMIENNLTEDKLKLFDATGLTEKEQKEGVKKLILERK